MYVRFTDQGDGALGISELYIDGRGKAIPPALLRNIPLSNIEGWLLNGRLGRDIGLRLSRPGPDLSRLASYLVDGFVKPAKHWVYLSFRAQDPTSGVEQPPVKSGNRKDMPAPESLAGPTDGLTDDFLGKVADAYAWAVSQGKRPAKELAGQASVSPRTVHQWVYLARQRGIMPPGRRGRVG